MATGESLEDKVTRLEKELDAAVTYARTEAERAKTAEHWKRLAEQQNRKGAALRVAIYEVLRAEGYHIRSYSHLIAPRGEEVVEGAKYEPGEYHVLGAVKHLIDRAKTAEAALAAAQE